MKINFESEEKKAMNNGGYIMVDCGGLNLLGGHSTAQTIPNLYKTVKTAIESGKPIIATNCEYGEGESMTPIPVFAVIESDVLIVTASILQVRIVANSTTPTSGDVTIYNMITDFD